MLRSIRSRLIASYLLVILLTHPLRRLTDAASALAHGELVTPVSPASTSELRALGMAFNTMSANLATAHDALAAQAHQREAILNGLADAVLAVDGAGEVILANPAASVLLQVTPQALHPDWLTDSTFGRRFRQPQVAPDSALIRTENQ